MPYTNDPTNSNTDRVRLVVGDTDTFDEGFSDEIYTYVLTKHENDEAKAAVEILTMLLAKYASYVTEKAGGLFAKESEKYQQYKDLYDLLVTDPRSALIKAGAGFTGGISVSKRDGLRDGSDYRANPLNTEQLPERPRFNILRY